MRIDILHFGELECKEDEMITFPKGLFGFPEETLFFLQRNPDEAPFMLLQSLNTSYLAFVVLDPWLVEPDYAFDLPKEAREELQIDGADDIMVLSIVVVPEDVKEMTINLRAPLVINLSKRVGEQIILSEDRLSIRHPILKG